MEQNVDAGTPVVPVVENKQKSGNGLKIATAIACVVAVCGIGFGIYGMIQSSQKDDQISNLKIQVEDSNGKNTTLETEKDEIIDEEDVVVTITDSASIKSNPVIISSNVEGSVGDGYHNIYVLNASGNITSDRNMNKSWALTSYDGDLTCRIMENYTAIDDCDISAHSGKVSNIYNFNVGNGGEGYMLILTDAGEIEYLSDINGDYKVLKKLNLPKKVSQVYSNISSRSVNDAGNFLSGGRDAIIVYSDGQMADFYDIMHK